MNHSYIFILSPVTVKQRRVHLQHPLWPLKMPSGSSSAAYSSAMGSQCHWTDRHCSQLWCHIVHCRHHGPGAQEWRVFSGDSMEKQWKTIINFPFHFWTIPAADESNIITIIFCPQVPIQKKSTAVLSLKSTISQHSKPPSNHQLPGVHPSTSSNDLGLCTEFLGGVATLRGANDSLDFHLGWRDACSLGSTLAEWRWSALGRIID